MINVVGALRVAFALAAAVLARVLLRRRGVFYTLAGVQSALADDCDGTMPPFDRVREQGCSIRTRMWSLFEHGAPCVR